MPCRPANVVAARMQRLQAERLVCMHQLVSAACPLRCPLLPPQKLRTAGRCLASRQCPSQPAPGKVSRGGVFPPRPSTELGGSPQRGEPYPAKAAAGCAAHVCFCPRPLLSTEVEAELSAAEPSTPAGDSGAVHGQPGSSSDEAAGPADGADFSEVAQLLPGRAGPSAPGLRWRQRHEEAPS